MQSVIEDQADGTTKQKELATATIKAYLTPIPPLAEQRRILAKLSEVLPVVKSYGAVYDETEAMQQAFPERLKKSILQEAVQSKLVSQDPSDEPAEALLERIRAEKQRLIKELKRTSTNLSFSDGIILIMRSWTVRRAVSTMNCRLRYQIHGSGCGL